MTETVASNGCKYRNYGTFTVVVTPHAVERKYERHFDGDARIDWLGLAGKLRLDNRNQYIVVDQFQCFLNKKWNNKRNRLEVEVISFTPDNWHKRDDILVAVY